MDPSPSFPMTPAIFSIILSLATHDRHGYGIMQEVASLTQGQIRLNPGTLYRSLKLMLQRGVIEEVDERPDPALDDERRRYYRLTAYGRQVGQMEAHRLSNLVGRAREAHLLGEEVAPPQIEGGLA